MWGALIGAGLGAGMGLIQGNRKADADRRYNQGQAEMTKYAPWTGRAGEIKQASDPMDSMIQGATAGGMFGNQFGGAAAPTSVGTGVAGSSAANASNFGGAGMASELGQFGQPAMAASAQPNLYSSLAGAGKQPYGLGAKFSFNGR